MALATLTAGVATMVLAGPTSAAPWGYELVSPAVKGGGVISPEGTFQARDDGNALLWSSYGSISGAEPESTPLYTRYLASRAATSWNSRPVDPPFRPIRPNSNSTIMATVGTSRNLAYAVVASTVALAPGATEGGGNVYLRSTLDGSYSLIATSPSKLLTSQFTSPQGSGGIKYVANDGQDVIFSSLVPLVPGAPDGTSNPQDGDAVYHWSAAGGIEAVSLLPQDEGGGFAPAAGGVGFMGEDAARNSLPSEDGAARIYFYAEVERLVFPFGRTIGPVYVREGSETRRISVSQIPGDVDDAKPGRVVATTSHGSFMVFTTEEATPLTTDTPVGLGGVSKYIYRYDAASGDLSFAGALGGGANSANDNVLQMSDDGRSIVFVSTLDLGDGGVAGENNFYFWRDGELRLIATADPGSFVAGKSPFMRLLSPNGRFFAFTENSVGIAARFGFDNMGRGCGAGMLPAPCGQMYVYDWQGGAGQGSLACASCLAGVEPRDHAGDPSVPGPGILRMNARQARIVTDDGSVFFATRSPLAKEDSNGLADVYRVRAGQVELVSRASQGRSARFLDTTPDGSAVFMSTDDPIVKADVDQAVDVYLARVGGGFPDGESNVEAECSGGDCRSGEPRHLPFGSPGTSGAGALSGVGDRSASQVRARVRLRGIERRGSQVRVAIEASVPGRVSVSASGLRTVRRQVRSAGRVVVTLRMTKKAAGKLRRTGRLSVQVRASLSPPFGKASVARKRLTVRS